VQSYVLMNAAQIKTLLSRIKNTNIDTALNAVFRCSCLLLVLGIASKLALTSNLTVKNEELTFLQQEKVELEKQLSGLTYQACELSSLKYVEERASKLGFVPMTERILSLNVDEQPKVAVLAQ
jgi:cell division protein FtsB